MKKTNNLKAFSLVELSIVILIIGVLVAAVGQGLDLYEDSKITAARTITQSSRASSIKGIALWVDATADSFGAEIADNDSVQKWFDINPQNTVKDNFVQTDSAQMPKYKTKAINGLPAIKFDGVAQNMYISSFADIAPSNGITAFAVLRSPSPLPASGIDKAIYSKRLAAGGAINTQLSMQSGGFTVNEFHGINFFIISQTASPDNVYIVSYQNGIISGTPTHKSFINGKGVRYFNNSYSPINPSSSTDYFYIGKPGLTTVPSTPTYFDGYIGELLIYERFLSKKDRQSIEAYLGKKWNIKMTVESAY